MNPYLHILQSLRKATSQFSAPNAAVKAAGGNQINPALAMQHPMQSNMGNGQPPNTQTMLNPQAQLQQVHQQQQQNPYLSFLQQRLGVKQNQSPQQSQPFSTPGQESNVMSGNFNNRNLVIPQQNQIKSNLAIDPEKQGRGDIIQ